MPRLKSKDSSEVKNQVIRLRVTETEAEQFKANAEAAGCKSISDYIRSRCIEDSDVDKIAKK